MKVIFVHDKPYDIRIVGLIHRFNPIIIFLDTAYYYIPCRAKTQRNFIVDEIDRDPPLDNESFLFFLTKLSHHNFESMYFSRVKTSPSISIAGKLIEIFAVENR